MLGQAGQLLPFLARLQSGSLPLLFLPVEVELLTLYLPEAFRRFFSTHLAISLWPLFLILLQKSGTPPYFTAVQIYCTSVPAILTHLPLPLLATLGGRV